MPPPRKNNKLTVKPAFTLAEVLITLGVIGVVAAITLPAVITKIQNKGYVERLKKTYAALQIVTTQLADEGLSFDVDAEKITKEQGYDIALAEFQNIANSYASKMKVNTVCKYFSYDETPCHMPVDKYKYLNKTINNGHYCPFMGTFSMSLQDGTSIGIRFGNQGGGMTLWNVPQIRYAVDVNGKKGPNTMGRDIFYLYYENGKIKPAGDGNKRIGLFGKDDCNKNDLGFGCAYKVLKEGKINY